MKWHKKSPNTRSYGPSSRSCPIILSFVLYGSSMVHMFHVSLCLRPSYPSSNPSIKKTSKNIITCFNTLFLRESSWLTQAGIAWGSMSTTSLSATVVRVLAASSWSWGKLCCWINRTNIGISTFSIEVFPFSTNLCTAQCS